MLICELEIGAQGLGAGPLVIGSWELTAGAGEWASEPIRQPGSLFVLFFVVFVVELRGVTEA